MSLVRKRYYYWLVKAYIKRWGKTVTISLLLGSAFFFVIIFLFSILIRPVLEKKVEKIGLSGEYVISNLPDEISSLLSYGLTDVNKQGRIVPRAAIRWEIKDQGKKYTFFIKRGQRFHNNKELTAELLTLEFEKAKKIVSDKYIAEYVLKEPYSPFLSSVSERIILPDGSGLGEYKISDAEFNAGYLKSVSLTKVSDSKVKKNFLIYPTERSLLTAFMLGEVDEIRGLNALPITDKSFFDWNNIEIKKEVNYDRLVTLFFNMKDKELSNIKLRQALNYALPENFPDGVRAESPIPPVSIFYSKSPNSGIYDKDLARTLLEDIKLDKTVFEISTTSEFEGVAKLAVAEWKKIGINSKISIVNEVPPDNFQIFIYSFIIPADPDQYTLWHSAQENNITHYNNTRIDKLLEDGRVTINVDDRLKIYADFQKYLINDTPASFLYFPYRYTLARKKII